MTSVPPITNFECANYQEALLFMKQGHKIRCGLMPKGEHIEWDAECNSILWWDRQHKGYWSWPMDTDEQTYLKYVTSKDWHVCDSIKPVKEASSHDK